jgi:hypothetical protein
MAMQEFLASYAVKVDEDGARRLQAILERNREAGAALASVFSSARSALAALKKELSESVNLKNVFSSLNTGGGSAGTAGGASSGLSGSSGRGTATSGSYPITGLTPETDYIIQVRGDYGSDSKSEWVESLFTTPAVNTSISIATDPYRKGEGSIYTIDGVKLDKMPTRKGVYIQNKRKVVM